MLYSKLAMDIVLWLYVVSVVCMPAIILFNSVHLCDIIISFNMHLFVAHTMDIGESKGKGRGKGKGKSSKLAAGRAKPINWPLELSEFLLDWYIEKKLQLPPKAVIKKIHHTACTSAINSKYGTTYTVDQVQRHYRRHKENWSLVARHLNESGNGWDETTKMLTLSQATLDALSVITCPLEYNWFINTI